MNKKMIEDKIMIFLYSFGLPIAYKLVPNITPIPYRIEPGINMGKYCVEDKNFGPE
jgi:hypothetical protein